MNTTAIKNSRFDRGFDIVVVILLTLVLLVVAYPLYFIAVASFSDPVEVMTGRTLLIPRGVSLRGYAMVFRDNRILTGYANSLYYTVMGTLFGLFLTIGAGYALSKNQLWGTGVIMRLMVFTMYFSGGLIPTYLVVKKLGLIDTRAVLVILGSFSVINTIIARTFFKSTISPELEEAAEIDGCSPAGFLFRIALPLSKSIIAVISLYYGVAHWNSFFNALIYVSKPNYYPLQMILRDILISNKMIVAESLDPREIAEIQKAVDTIKYGVIIVASAPMLILYSFLQRFFVKGVMIGSIKG